MSIFNWAKDAVPGEETKNSQFIEEDNSEDGTMEEENYGVEVNCTNCYETNSVELKLGVLVEDGIKEIACETCGCKTLRKLPMEE